MKPSNDNATNTPSTRKPREKGIKNDEEKLKIIVAALDKQKMTKEALATETKIDKGLLTEGVFLAAAKLTKNIAFLDNLITATPGRTQAPPKYNKKKGLLIQPSHFKNINIKDDQIYSLQFGENGIITLLPLNEVAVDQKK